MEKLLRLGLVYVRSYVRMRFGRLEHVRSHYRSYPGFGGLGPVLV